MGPWAVSFRSLQQRKGMAMIISRSLVSPFCSIGYDKFQPVCRICDGSLRHGRTHSAAGANSRAAGGKS